MQEAFSKEPSPTANQISGGVFFHAVIQGKDITVQLPPEVTPALSGLPPASFAFTGREQLVEELLQSLTKTGREGVNLKLAIAGLPGVGKTELAIQVAARALKDPGLFRGGVLFIDMFGYDDMRRLSSERALESMLSALGMPHEHIPNQLQDRSRLYRSVLASFADQGRRILVVVDNVSNVEQVRPLIPADGTSAVLLTSRHTMDVGAHLYDLPVLDLDSSVELLQKALQHGRGASDTRVQDEAKHASTVAHLCGGLPLALHIAGALLADTPTRPVASLVDSLTAAHTRLDRLRRDDRAVRAALDLSYQHLEHPHARMFRLLTINPGPDLSTESAGYIAAIDRAQAEELLQDLARAHLVEPGKTWGRWRIHDLVRLYADEQGIAQADVDSRNDALARLVRHYESTTLAADTHLPASPFQTSTRFESREKALEWLDAERPNLITAATATVAFNHSDIITIEPPRDGAFKHYVTAIAQTPGSALFRYLLYRRSFDDMMTISTAALSSSKNSHDHLGQALALNALGITFRETRRFDDSINAHTQCVAICRELGDRHNEAMGLTNLANALIASRRPGKAGKALIRSARLFARTGDRMGEGHALTGVGLVLCQMQRYTEAVDMHTKAFNVLTELDDRHSEGTVLNNLGVTLRYMERFEDALDAHTRAVAAFTEAGSLHEKAGAQSNLGLAFWKFGQPKKAIKEHSRSRATFAKLGDRHKEAEALDNLGIALCEVARFEQAIDAHTQARTLFIEQGDRHAEGIALTNLAGALTEVERFEEAIQVYTLSGAAFAEVGDRQKMRLVATNLDKVHRRLEAGCAMEFSTEARNSQITAITERLGVSSILRWARDIRSRFSRRS